MQPNNQNNQFFQPQHHDAPIQPVATPQQPTVNRVPFPSEIPKKESHIGRILLIAALTVALIGSLIFGFWAFAGRQDYKNNTDQKVAAAVKAAETATTEKNTIAFNESQKSPLKKYVGPASYGTVSVEYPKTWSGYISSNTSGSEPLVALFHPDYVPANSGNSNSSQPIALAVTVLNQTYDSVMTSKKSYTSSADVTAAPYVLPKMPNQVGMKISGKIDNNYNGTQVILPLRDKTLVITTQTDQWLNDFNTYILPNITFVP